MTSVLQWLSPLWEFINSQSGTILVLVLGFGILVYAVVRPENNTLSDEQLALEMKAQLSKDSDNFEQSLFIHDIKINWSPLRETDPNFTVDFNIYSSSVFRLDIGKKCDGHLRYGSNLMERSIELVNPIVDMERSSVKHLTLRQWVSPPRLNQIRLDGGKIARLIFADINIRVEGKVPGQSVSLISRLPILSKLDALIPRWDEL